MIKFIYLLSFVAAVNPMYENAGETSRRAILEMPEMKNELRELEDDAERQLFLYTGMTREDVAYAGYMYPIFAGKLSSKPFTNFKIETKSKWVVRPEIEYVFKDQSSTYGLYLVREF